jgi:hypothetical protein
MKKFNKLFLSSLLFSSIIFSQTNIFSDNFDSYTPDLKIACQNPSVWTTWSNLPCSFEDAVISDNYSYSGSNSCLNLWYNDLVKDFGPAFSSGRYRMSFKAYIPTGKDGYFNTLATFDVPNSNYYWGMECYFTTTGICSVYAGSTTANISSTYPIAAWFPVEVVVDLDNDQAQLSVNNAIVTTWQWTLGSRGFGSPLTLDANDFFGQNPTNEFYIDDYVLDNLPPVSVDQENTTPVEFSLSQNYPNPFNPATSIEYAIGSRQFVTLKVCDLLGEEVATLVNEEQPAGKYEVEFDGSGLSSGIYIYKIAAGNFVETKKMILLK